VDRTVTRAIAWGLGVTLALGALIWIGSRRLAHFDAALAAYTAAVLFAAFGLTYRYAVWLQRPPTAVLWRRGWQAFLRGERLGQNAVDLVRYTATDLAANRFIFARGGLRGLAHLLIMWGCLLAVAITFPLVFGWLHFESEPGDLARYRAYVFGFPTFSFAVDSWIGFVSFHGLVWASLLVIAGVMLAFRRRMREESAAAVQIFGEDLLPLVLLFAVSLTGLMLTASYTWMRGYAFDFVAILIATFLWLPFGKLFHVFQRPAQIGARFYKAVGAAGEPAHCRRCGAAFTSRMHAEDLIDVEQRLGFRYECADPAIGHYQWICPPCRRALLALAQGRLWGRASSDLAPARGERSPSTPTHANPGLGEGPLGEEDRRNFHP
jgi:cbb3-type cytochrome oxidase subunit 3